MNAKISDDIRSERPLYELVQRANNFLKRLTFGSGISMTAEWRLERDTQGRLLVVLELADATGATAEARFTADELAREGHVNPGLYKVWGDLLQSRSHKQLELLSGRIDGGE